MADRQFSYITNMKNKIKIKYNLVHDFLFFFKFQILHHWRLESQEPYLVLNGDRFLEPAETVTKKTAYQTKRRGVKM
jgi:hypothetical protein